VLINSDSRRAIQGVANARDMLAAAGQPTANAGGTARAARGSRAGAAEHSAEDTVRQPRPPAARGR